MADVIALPTAAAEPPPNTRRRGRLPKIVSSIAHQRQKRLFAMWDREKQIAEQVMEKMRREEAAAAEQRSTERWPFPGIDRSRFDELTEMQRGEVQYVVRRAIELFEARAPAL